MKKTVIGILLVLICVLSLNGLGLMPLCSGNGGSSFAVQPVAIAPLTDLNSSIYGLEIQAPPSPVNGNFTVDIHLTGATHVSGIEVHLFFGNILAYASPKGFIDLLGTTIGVLTGPQSKLLYGIAAGFYDADGNGPLDAPYTGAVSYNVAAASTNGPQDLTDGIVAIVAFMLTAQPTTEEGDQFFPLVLDYTDIVATGPKGADIPGMLTLHSGYSADPLPPETTHIVRLESLQDNGVTSNLGTVTFDSVSHTVPADLSYASGTYQATYYPASNYFFDHWEVTGNVTVSSSTVNPASVTVKSIGGTLEAVYKPPSYPVHLESVQDNSATSNLGTVTIDGDSHGLPADLSYASGTHQANCYPGAYYMFNHWEVTGEITVSSSTANPTSVTVSSPGGTLRAVYKQSRYPFHMESRQDNSATSNLGTIQIAGPPNTLPADLYEYIGNWQPTYYPAPNYAFDHWEVTGGITVGSSTVNPASVTVTSPGGTLRAVYKQYTGTTILSVVPASVTVAVGQEFTVDVDLDDAENLFAYDFSLSFDNSVLNAVSVEYTGYLGTGSNILNPIIEINNAGGYVSIAVSRLVKPGVTGGGVLGTVHFEAVASGASPIHLYDTVLVDDAGYPIDHRTQDGQVTVLNTNLAVQSVTVTVGQEFTVDVDLDYAENLFAYEFSLSFDKSVLNAVSVEYTGYLGTGSDILNPMIEVNNAGGYVSIAVSRLVMPGVTGGGVLATIHFACAASGASPTHLYHTVLVDDAGYPIDHGTQDGQVTVLNTNLAVQSVTVANQGCTVYADDRDSNGNPYYVPVQVTVKNVGVGGTGAFNVSLTAYWIDGSQVESSVELRVSGLATGEEVVLTFGWHPLHTGSYSLTAFADCHYEVIETDEGDNTLNLSGYPVALKGDLDGSRRNDISDVAQVCLAWHSYPGDSKWNLRADLNHDGYIDILDIVRITLRWHQTW
jgi:hypothetical protein